MADKLRCQGQVLGTELSLHQEIADRIFQLWGRPMTDLFATKFNRKLGSIEVYCLVVPDSSYPYVKTQVCSAYEQPIFSIPSQKKL